MDDVYNFEWNNRKQAIAYHLLFHSSLGIQINHLIFLHTYLLGVFILSSCDWITFFLSMSPFMLYASLIIRPWHYCVLYNLFILIIATVGMWINLYLLGSVYLWETVVISLVIILFSFICQLVGHYLFEKIQAPPSLLHGFIAAPILEFQSFLMRMNVVDDERYYDSIRDDVKRKREIIEQHLVTSSLLH